MCSKLAYVIVTIFIRIPKFVYEYEYVNCINFVRLQNWTKLREIANFTQFTQSLVKLLSYANYLYANCMCAVKCLPILSLALFVLLHGVSHPQQHKFSRRILAGLLFSCVGDALLIWPEYFLHGMAAFGVAQV